MVGWLCFVAAKLLIFIDFHRRAGRHNYGPACGGRAIRPPNRREVICLLGEGESAEAAEEGVGAGEELAEGEGLEEVVVSAVVEGVDDGGG